MDHATACPGCPPGTGARTNSPARSAPAAPVAPVADEPGSRYTAVSGDGAWQVHDTHRRKTLPGRYDQATADQVAADLNGEPLSV